MIGTWWLVDDGLSVCPGTHWMTNSMGKFPAPWTNNRQYCGTTSSKGSPRGYLDAVAEGDDDNTFLRRTTS